MHIKDETQNDKKNEQSRMKKIYKQLDEREKIFSRFNNEIKVNKYNKE